MSELEDRWRIKEFAAHVGVQEATLRAWERRYDLLAPERSAGGYRLYSPADERRVRAMQAHMARGIAAAQAATLALAEAAGPFSAPAEPGALVDSLIAATESFDATRFDALLDAAFARGLRAGIDDVVLPALAAVGLRWERNQLSVGQEHFASHLVERRLLALTAGWDAGRGPLALLACPPRELHTLGLVCFGLLLADRGWRIAYLGADTPIGEITGACATLRPAAVVLCALDGMRFSDHAEAIAGLGRSHRTILAGAGANAKLVERLCVELAAGGPAVTARALAGQS